ncbi:MAG: glycoside hydrolase family 3 protein [Candidatus Gastranaerophilales bacterium]|nr:glycoside hydrolase family 3 protein [Candidatus Gastranaerophilales bacterium]
MKKIIFSVVLMLFSSVFANNLDEKISQMIMVGFNGNTANSKGFQKILKDIDLISGVILFDKNIEDFRELNKMTTELKQKSKITPFIAIDNEGGQILRFDFLKVKSAKEISQNDIQNAHDEYFKLASTNYEAGINLNFAPVVDLEINEESIISKKERSYSSDYRIVDEYAQILIDEHKKYGIITALKHFPGHGSIKGDTHLGFVDNTDVFEMDELMPYYNLKNNNKNTMVMVSHIFNGNIDDKYPASLSEKTINGLLKEKIGFEGVVISDDFDMGAIRDNYELDEIVTLAINSGVDILLFSNNLNYYDKNIYKKIHKIIKREIKKGNIKEENIEKSYQKIMELKKNL